MQLYSEIECIRNRIFNHSVFVDSTPSFPASASKCFQVHVTLKVLVLLCAKKMQNQKSSLTGGAVGKGMDVAVNCEINVYSSFLCVASMNY